MNVAVLISKADPNDDLDGGGGDGDDDDDYYDDDGNYGSVPPYYIIKKSFTPIKVIVTIRLIRML